MSNFHFIRPLWLLGIIPVIGLYLLNRSIKNRTASENLFSKEILSVLTYKEGLAKYVNYFHISLYTLFFLSIILAGPTFKRVETPFNVDKSKVLLAFQLTESMDSEELLPTKLERAKVKMIDFLDKNKTSLIALSAYSSKSYSALSITKDRQTIKPFLQALSTQVMPVEGNIVSSLITQTNKVFKDRKEGNYLVIISDGAKGQDFTALIEDSRAKGYKIITYGVGKETLDKSSLSELSGGNFVEFTSTDKDIDKIAEMIEPYFPNEQNTNVPWKELGYKLSFLLLFPFLLYFRKGVVITFSIALITLVSQQRVEASPLLDPWLTKHQQGQLYLKLNKFDKAAESFTDPLWKARSYYLAEDFKNAEVFYSQLDDKESRFALANSIAHQSYFLTAFELYQELANEFPEDERFKTNMKIVDDLMKEIDAFGESQKKEGHSQIKKQKQGDKQRSRGAKAKGAKEEKKSAKEINEISIENWYNQLNSDLESFLTQKFRIQDATEDN